MFASGFWRLQMIKHDTKLIFSLSCTFQHLGATLLKSDHPSVSPSVYPSVTKGVSAIT